jgi:hypothetical protein
MLQWSLAAHLLREGHKIFCRPNVFLRGMLGLPQYFSRPAQYSSI